MVDKRVTPYKRNEDKKKRIVSIGTIFYIFSFVVSTDLNPNEDTET